MHVITGMHRSGTSMIANLVYELGGDFGPDAELLAADQWNARGYYEYREVFLLNDSILLGGWAPSRKFWTTRPEDRSLALRGVMQFARLAYFIRLWNAAGTARRARLHAAEIADLTAQIDHLVVKDPRLSLLIGQWAESGNVERILYCYRHPFEVASSLRKRGSSPMWLNYALWTFHVREFFRQAEGIPVVVTDYNAFFTDQRYDEMKRLYAFLGKPYDEADARQRLDAVIDPALKKNTADATLQLPPRIATLYDSLHDYHTRYDTPQGLGRP